MENLIESFLNKDYEKYLGFLYETLKSKPSNKEKADIYSKILFISAMNLGDIHENRIFLEAMVKSFDLITDVKVYNMRSVLLHLLVSFETKTVTKPFVFDEDQKEFSMQVYDMNGVQTILNKKKFTPSDYQLAKMYTIYYNRPFPFKMENLFDEMRSIMFGDGN